MRVRTIVVSVIMLFASVLNRDGHAESYLEATATDQPFECKYELDSFFGETEPFVAQIQGTSFRAVSSTVDLQRSNLPFNELLKRAKIHYWRLGDIAYLLQTDEPDAFQFDLAAVARAAGVEISILPGSMFYSPLPPPDARCSHIIDRPPLDLPGGVEFVDSTQALIDKMSQQAP